MNLGTDRRGVVIEDDDDLRDMICAVLERAGLTVVTAANGLDGLAAVRATNPVVVTVDLKMPGISGLETVARIRGISDALIVVLSAMTAQNDEDESLQAGADVFILKPFHTRQLHERVAQRLNDLDNA